MIDRKIAPDSRPFRPFAIKQTQTVKLGNGVPVHFLQSGSQPITRLEFIFRAGSWFESQNGLSYLSAKMLTEGTEEHNAKEIAEIIALHGAFVEVHHGFEHVNVSFYLMEKHMSSLLPVISKILTASSFPEHELESLKTITVQTTKVNKEKTQFLASTEYRKTLFGLTHPYGRHYWEEDIQQISREDVYVFAKQHFYVGNMEIFLSGQFNRDKVLGLLEHNFGRDKVVGLPQKYLTTRLENNAAKQILVEKQDAIQSSIRYGGHCISRDHVDFAGLLVVNELLGGFFGSRLMKNIREDKGYTYGIHSSVHSMLHGAYFVIATDVKKENTTHTLTEIEKEICVLRDESVSVEELETVKSYMLGRFMNTINTPFSLMDKFKLLHFNGLGYEYFENYVKEIQDQTPESVRELALRHLDINRFTEVVIGGV